MIQAGTGYSNNINPADAGAEAVKQALAKTNGKADLVIVFSTVDYDQNLILKGAKQEAPGAILAGCSTMRGILGGQGIEKGVISMALLSDEIKFQLSVSQGAKEDPVACGKKLGELINKPDLSALMIFMESVGVNGSAVVRGIQQTTRPNLPIIGGMASDASTFTASYQYAENEALTNSVVGVGMFGSFSMGIGVQHGWESVGLPVKVTKSEGAIIKEIEHKPAIKFFEDYFGPEEAKQLYQPLSKICYVYPLGMSVEKSDELLIRNAFVANENGEIICAGEVPQGSEIRLMLGDAEKAISAAKQAAQKATQQLKDKKPKAVIVFNCAARYMLLGNRVDEEIKAIENFFGKDVPLIGFYTYGEQAPLAGFLGESCRSEFHNETMALMVLGE